MPIANTGANITETTEMSKQKIRRDKYTFDADEFLDAAGEDVELALGYAIDAARERARIYVIPCRWEAVLRDDKIIVFRYRRA